MINTSIFNTQHLSDIDEIECAETVYDLLMANNELNAVSEVYEELCSIGDLQEHQGTLAADLDYYLESLVDNNISPVYTTSQEDLISMLINSIIRTVSKILHKLKMLIIKFVRFIGKKLGLITEHKAVSEKGHVLIKRNDILHANELLDAKDNTDEFVETLGIKRYGLTRYKLFVSIATCKKIMQETSDDPIKIPITKIVDTVHLVNTNKMTYLIPKKTGEYLSLHDMQLDIDYLNLDCMSPYRFLTFMQSTEKEYIKSLHLDTDKENKLVSVGDILRGKVGELSDVININDALDLKDSLSKLSINISKSEKGFAKMFKNASTVDNLTEDQIKEMPKQLNSLSAIINRVCISAAALVDTHRNVIGVSV